MTIIPVLESKIGGVVDEVEGCCRLQRDIDRMQSWAEKWQMEFNPDKCEVLHFGRTNLNVDGGTERSWGPYP